MRRSRRRIALLVLLACALGPAAALLATLGVAAAGSAPAGQISQAAAIADAKRQLPNDGAGFEVLKAELEPSSLHFNFVGVDGSSFGEDGVKECLVVPPIPPLPFITPCRPYPVWVVQLGRQACETSIAINAHTGRFGGAGMGWSGAGDSSGSCQIVPDVPVTAWFQPTWE